jgi:lycopene cyclase domain-containing protein
MTYTSLAIVGVAFAVALDLWVLRTRLLASRVFWTAYAIVLFFQLLTNGWLTKLGVVTYAPEAILGPRLAFAPVEDLLFGFSLVVQTLAWWVWWGRRLTPHGDGPDAPAPGQGGRRVGGR